MKEEQINWRYKKYKRARLLKNKKHNKKKYNNPNKMIWSSDLNPIILKNKLIRLKSKNLYQIDK